MSDDNRGAAVHPLDDALRLVSQASGLIRVFKYDRTCAPSPAALDTIGTLRALLHRVLRHLEDIEQDGRTRL